jgi:uncharacterized protein YbjT (DUF2867 family)
MTILVTGATGNVGPHVVRELRMRGLPVRALVRDRAKAADLLGDDVELAVVDFADRALLRATLTDVNQVYLCTPNHPLQVEWEIGLIDAAIAAGVRRVVKQTTMGAEVGAATEFWDMHGRIGDYLRQAPIASVFLACNFFMSNLLASADGVRQAGALFLPGKAARVAMVDPRDVAAAAATVLAGGEHHDGRSYELTGPEAVTFDDVAAALSEVSGQHVGFVAVPDDAAREQLVGGGAPPWFADNLVAMMGLLRQGAGARVTDALRALTGRQPTSVSDYLRAHAAAFAAATTVSV